MKQLQVNSYCGVVGVEILSESAKEIVFQVYDYEFSIVGKGNHEGRDLNDANWFKVVCEGQEVFNGYRDDLYFCFVSPFSGSFRSDKNIVAAAAMIVAMLY